MKTNKLLKILSLSFCTLAFINCSDKEDTTDSPSPDDVNDTYINPTAPQGPITVEAVKSNAAPFLGAGYDIMGEYISNLSVKAPVLDLNKIGEGRITIFNGSSSEGERRAGRDIKEFLQSFNEFKEFVVPTENRGDLLFPATITNYACFKERYEHSSQYTFIFETSGANISIQKINRAVPKWDSWLTDDFREALIEYSPDEVIQEYGTHILVDINLGYAIKTLYRSIVADSESELIRTAITGLGARKDMVYKFPNVSITYPEETVKKNYGGTIAVSLQGGDYKKMPPLQLTPDRKEVVGDPMNVTSWAKTCDENTYALTTLTGNSMIPIYDVITDPEKKKQLKDAVIKYIKAHQPAMQQTAPIFQATDGKGYRYYTSYSKLAENTEACQGVIASVFVFQGAETVPLYLSSSRNSDRLSLDNSQESNSSIIGYVYEKQSETSGALERIYELSDGKSFAYTREQKESYGEKGSWKLTGKYFYTKKV